MKLVALLPLTTDPAKAKLQEVASFGTQFFSRSDSALVSVELLGAAKRVEARAGSRLAARTAARHQHFPVGAKVSSILLPSEAADPWDHRVPPHARYFLLSPVR